MEGKRVQKPEPVAASCNGLLFWKTPGRMPGRRVLRPWKNFAVFRRFPRAETALEPGCGADLEAKRRIWNPETRCKRLQRALFGNPGPDAGKGIYVLGRISRNFDEFPAVTRPAKPGPRDRRRSRRTGRAARSPPAGAWPKGSPPCAERTGAGAGRRTGGRRRRPQ